MITNSEKIKHKMEPFLGCEYRQCSSVLFMVCVCVAEKTAANWIPQKDEYGHER